MSIDQIELIVHHDNEEPIEEGSSQVTPEKIDAGQQVKTSMGEGQVVQSDRHDDFIVVHLDWVLASGGKDNVCASK